MTQQPADDGEPEELPTRILAIRKALPEDLREQFDEEICEAADEVIAAEDFAVVDRVKARWWARAKAHLDAERIRGLEVKPEGDGPMRGFLMPADDEADGPPDGGVPAIA